MIVEAKASRIFFDPKPLPQISNEVGSMRSFSKSNNVLISMKMHIVDNPPAYSSHSGAPPSESMSISNPPFLSPTVDQVHIFSRHEDIKGIVTISSFYHLLMSVQEPSTSIHVFHCLTKVVEGAGENRGKCPMPPSGLVKRIFPLIWVQ